jgi:hypothetical protein
MQVIGLGGVRRAHVPHGHDVVVCRRWHPLFNRDLGGVMRTMRSGIAVVATVLGAGLGMGPGLRAQQPVPANDLYPATRQFGTGLIDIPVAWVSPTSGDIWLQVSATQIPYSASSSELNLASRWNSNFAIDTHWGGRASVGLSIYSQNPEWGFFGQALLVKEHPGRAWPAVAVGFRNLGTHDHEDRLLVGEDLKIDANGGAETVVSSYAQHFHTAPTIYGVATKSFAVGARNTASLSLGYGSGLFYDDGKLGAAYNDKGQIVRGLFLGGRYALHPTDNTRVDLLAENNGWDWNAGMVGSWRGLSLGIYGTELEEGSKSSSKGPLYNVYNYAKLNVTLGYSGNLPDIGSGSVLRSRVAELQREEARLRTELAHREERVVTLETSLRKAQAGELADVAKRREELEGQIQEERDAIQQAEDRLKKLQQGQQPSTPPSPSQPTSPPSGTKPPAR